MTWYGCDGPTEPAVTDAEVAERVREMRNAAYELVTAALLDDPEAMRLLVVTLDRDQAQRVSLALASFVSHLMHDLAEVQGHDAVKTWQDICLLSAQTDDGGPDL